LDVTENKHLVRLMLALDKDDNNTLRDELLSCLNEDVALLAAEDTNQVVKLVIASLERFVVQKSSSLQQKQNKIANSFV
jgi:DNA-binding protein Fis